MTPKPSNDAVPDISHLEYQVLEYQLGGYGFYAHIKVWRDDGEDGITWDELQAVKDEAIGPQRRCIEMYPPHDQVVNDVNYRHLWEIPHDILPSRFLWRPG